jgi:hypothetical protein
MRAAPARRARLAAHASEKAASEIFSGAPRLKYGK